LPKRGEDGVVGTDELPLRPGVVTLRVREVVGVLSRPAAALLEGMMGIVVAVDDDLVLELGVLAAMV
jgi:hypothetical protein